MPRKKKSVPSYLHHKPSGQAYIRIKIDGARQVVYLGKYDTPESREAYRQTIAQLEAIGPSAVISQATGTRLTVNEMFLAFLTHAETHYRDPDGLPTGEVKSLKLAIRPARKLFGTIPAAEFSPKALKAVRQSMIEAKLSRGVINRRIDRVKRSFKWAVSEELISVSVYEALRTVTGLRAGRSAAKESERVMPVEMANVQATLPFLNRHLRAMVELQRYTGMRPGEVCKFSLAEVDRSGEVWLFQLSRHKTTHRGKERVIPLGPKAREVIIAFLIDDKPPPAGFEAINLIDKTARLVAADAYQEAGRIEDANLLRSMVPVAMVAGCVIDPTLPLFSPKEAREERYRALRTNRKSKVPPSQVNRKVKNPKRMAGSRYRTESYAHAVQWAAGVPHWHPNQLRHTFATEVRKSHGLEAAQVLLGHSRADVTQVYAERNLALAVSVASEIG